MPDDYSDEDVIARWEEFLESSDYRLKVIEVADHYPEQRSLLIPYSMLDLFDPDFSDLILQHPVKCLYLGKQAVRKMLPPGREGVDVHLRLTGLPVESRVEIRRIRSEHLGKLISVEGLVRKATEVRPKIIDALFQCMRCSAVIKEAQEGMFFKEPLECYKDQGGCGRTSGSTKFKLLSEESKYVDTQKIEMQESPEGLRGGAQPERLTGFIEDDLAGSVAPGDRVVMNGVVRSVQKGTVQKSTLFDINLDVLSVEFKTHEYEDVVISQEDEEEILAQSRDPALFKKIIGSISPTIYGYDREKEAIALQLFGGVHKSLDDGTKIRGDIHVLLVGDPGVAKCVTGDAEVLLADCTTRPIKGIVEEAISKGNVQTVDDGVWAPLELKVMSFSMRGAIEPANGVRVWKRTAPPKMLRFTTDGGRTLTVTPTHPLFVQNGAQIQFRPAKSIYKGQNIAIATGAGYCGPDDTHGRRRGLDWDAVKSIESIDAAEPFVYDLEVDVTHNFVTNDIISHNSQILRYMSDLAPRGIYASGKSSSAAGLCVAPDSKILVDGKPVKIGEFVESKLTAPKEEKPGIWTQEIDGHKIASVKAGLIGGKELRSVWKLNTPSFLVEIVTAGGHRITLTPETRVMAKRFGMAGAFSRCDSLTSGDEALVRVDGEMRWVGLKEKREVRENLPPYVYDLTVDDSHCFIANDFAVHNTAAAVKDDFGEGRWTLEAGALVLADMGVACVDGEQFVVLADGIAQLKDLKPGPMAICGESRRELSRIRHVLDRSLKECIELRLYSGDSLICTPDHRVLTGDGWKEAGMLKKDDFLKIPVLCDANSNELIEERMETGFLHGFMLCDFVVSADDHSRRTSFSAAVKNSDRTEHVVDLVERLYGERFRIHERGPNRVSIRGQDVDFGETVQCYGWCLQAEYAARSVLDVERGAYFDHSYVIGFLAGIISMDCCVSHKKGPNGIKHEIIIQVGRKKYGDEWLERKQVLIASLLHSLGIMAVRRGRRLIICSLRSYNRVVDLIGPYVVGANKEKLFCVEPKTKIRSDDDLLDEDYHRWLESIKFRTPMTVKLGLHSRIWSAVNKRRTTETLMETLRQHWNEITDEPFREPEKGYLLNRVLSVRNAGWRHVYDLQMEDEPTFLVNGGLVHNCIDELDKMTDQDRSSMHEAMESQSVSVAKAGITARLQCRCSILGAANPKYGRFEESQFIADQIDLPPALMSRFDMIFAMTDKPEAEKDARITKHILSAHRRGEIFENEDRMVEDSEDIKRMLEETEGLKPAYSKEFFRKYIAYSKRFSPILSDDAMRLITDNYLMIRKQGEGEGKSVPITARQLEAYVRLSEASARARLSKVVTLDDAKRAVGIVEYYLRKIAGEGGGLDIDIIATGTSKSQREQILVIRDLIRNNAEKTGIGIEQLIMLAKDENIPEERVRTLLKRLKDSGEIFSPKDGYFKLASEGNE